MTNRLLDSYRDEYFADEALRASQAKQCTPQPKMAALTIRLAEVLKTSDMPFDLQVTCVACVQTMIENWGNDAIEPMIDEFTRRYGQMASWVLGDEYSNIWGA